MGRLLSGKGLAGVLSLAYMVIAARVLGPRDYGVLVLVHAFVLAVDGIVNFPAWQAVVRYGVAPLSEGRHHDLIRLMRFTAAVEWAVGIGAVAITAILSRWLWQRLGWSSEARDFALFYSLAALANVRSTPDGFLQILRRFDLLGWQYSASPSVRLVGAILAAAMGWGLHGFLVVWLIAALVECATMWAMGVWAAYKVLGNAPLIGPVSDMRGELPGLGRFMLGANGDATFAQVAPQILPLFVGWILGPAAAGIFAIAHRATVVIQQPAQIMGQAAYSEFVKMHHGEDGQRLVRRGIWQSIGIGIAGAIPILAILALFSTELATLIGGPLFAAAGAIMPWLAVARTIQIVIPVAGASLVAAGRPGLSVGSNFASTALTLPILALGLSHWGLYGAAAYAIGQALLSAGVILTLAMTAKPLDTHNS